jgi:hypothetical protein
VEKSAKATHGSRKDGVSGNLGTNLTNLQI